MNDVSHHFRHLLIWAPCLVWEEVKMLQVKVHGQHATSHKRNDIYKICSSQQNKPLCNAIFKPGTHACVPTWWIENKNCLIPYCTHLHESKNIVRIVLKLMTSMWSLLREIKITPPSEHLQITPKNLSVVDATEFEFFCFIWHESNLARLKLVEMQIASDQP